MPYTISGDYPIYFETFGREGDPPTIFIQAFAGQMIAWRKELYEKLIQHGMQIILFDNRDVGLSGKTGGQNDYDAQYSPEDMVDDAIRVLDTLGIASANVVGASMGGLIAQLMAIKHTERVRSLSVIYAAPSLEYATEHVRNSLNPLELMKRTTREEAIELIYAEAWNSRSTHYAFDEEWHRALAERSYDRCYSPDGAARQAAAMARAGNLVSELRKLSTPASVIHGRADPMVKFEGGIEIARALKNAELHLYFGMGHELPVPLFDEFVNIIARTVARGRR